MNRLYSIIAITTFLLACKTKQKSQPSNSLDFLKGTQIYECLPKHYPKKIGDKTVDIIFHDENGEAVTLYCGFGIGHVNDETMPSNFEYRLSNHQSDIDIWWEFYLGNNIGRTRGAFVSMFPDVNHSSHGFMVCEFTNNEREIPSGITFYTERQILDIKYHDIYCGQGTFTALSDGQKTDYEICIQDEIGVVAFSKDGKWYVTNGDNESIVIGDAIGEESGIGSAIER